jgi:hypothetical protein
MLKTPEALPISAAATELRIAFWAAGIAIETPTPANTRGEIRSAAELRPRIRDRAFGG